jgi:hypothetical protein
VNRPSTLTAAAPPLVQRLTVRGAQLVLTLAVALTTAVVAYVARHLHGEIGIIAALVAGAICWAGAASALTVTAMLRGPQHALSATFLGMGLRMGLPLLAALVVQLRNGPLAEAGFVFYLLACYAVALLVETSLSILLIKSSPSALQGRKEMN